MLKKGDFWVLVAVIAAALAAVVMILMPKGSKNLTVTVKQNNQTVYEKPLSINNKVELDGNTVVISDGTVFMEKADCNGQTCVKQKSIKKAGESIICLPNKVIVQIK